jgi:ATP-dependent RNA helicase RhlE
MELPLETESYVHRIGRTARAGESGAAISFVASEERGQLKAVERLIRKSIPVDRDHPFHSDDADRRSGKSGDGLPQAPWVHPANRNRTNSKRQKHKSFIGRRQPDFGQKR